MKKHFDFQASNKTISGFRKLRISEFFPLWKWQLSVFLFFLFSIFFVGSIFSSIHFLSPRFHQWKSTFVPYQEKFQTITLESSQEILKKISKDISRISQEMRIFLPAHNYSFTTETLQSFDLLSKDFLVLSDDLPSISHSFDTLLEGDASLFLEYIEKRKIFLQNFQQHLVSVVPFISKFQPLFAASPEVQTFLPVLLKGLDQFSELYNATTTLLGASEPQHILIWFQNNYEKRATGGFIGSYFDITINDGKIIQSSIRDIYELDGQIQKHQETPALAKSLVGKESWSLRDANFSPIFSESVETFLSMYEEAGGDSVDTVIAINNVFVEKVLEVIGPVFVENYNIELTSTNFSFITSYFVEGKFSSTHPKSILGEFLPVFIQKLKTSSGEQITHIAQLAQSHGAAFSYKKELQSLFTQYELTGNTKTLLEDSQLLPWYQVSISGNKSDAFVTQKIDMKKEQKQYTVTLSRKHEWGTDEEIRFENVKNIFGSAKMGDALLKNILGKGPNRSVFYFFLPEDVAMLQLKTDGISLKDHRLYGKHVFELELPLLHSEQDQTIIFQFSSSKNLKLQSLQEK